MCVSVRVCVCVSMSLREACRLAFAAPPFTYSGLLSSSADLKQRAVDAMRRDSNTLHGLEAIAWREPGVSEWVAAVAELICKPIRILYAAFGRDRFRINCPGGLRHLATLLIVLPDTVCVEKES